MDKILLRGWPQLTSRSISLRSLHVTQPIAKYRINYDQLKVSKKLNFFFLRFFQTRQANKIEFHKFLFHLYMPIIILYLCKYIRLRDEYILIQFHEFLLLLF